MFSKQDEIYMQRAIQLAETAATQGEVPVGAVLVLNNHIIGEGANAPIANHNPTAHAEIIALIHGAQTTGNYRLPESTLYVTLEPCIMCAGAMVHARIKRLVYGASDQKTGAIISRAQILDQTYLNHTVYYQGGLFADKCGSLLTQFFQARR